MLFAFGGQITQFFRKSFNIHRQYSLVTVYNCRFFPAQAKINTKKRNTLTEFYFYQLNAACFARVPEQISQNCSDYAAKNVIVVTWKAKLLLMVSTQHRTGRLKRLVRFSYFFCICFVGLRIGPKLILIYDNTYQNFL